MDAYLPLVSCDVAELRRISSNKVGSTYAVILLVLTSANLISGIPTVVCIIVDATRVGAPRIHLYCNV